MAFFYCFPWFSVPTPALARGPSAPLAGRSDPNSLGRLGVSQDKDLGFQGALLATPAAGVGN